jgi:hypothetical protein
MPTCGHVAEIRSKVVWVGDDGHRVDQLPALDWFRSGKRIRRCGLVETALSKPPGIPKLGGPVIAICDSAIRPELVRPGAKTRVDPSSGGNLPW